MTPTAFQAMKHQGVVAMEEASLIEGEAEVHIENKTLDQNPCSKKQKGTYAVTTTQLPKELLKDNCYLFKFSC